MPIPTEPIGSIPRPPELIAAVTEFAAGKISREQLRSGYEQAIRDTVRRFEATGSPVITDGEQAKPSFATYPIEGLENLAPDGITIPFADGHVRQLPRLTAGPVLGGRPETPRRSHLPRRRQGLDPQRRRGLWRAAARPLPAEGRELLHPTGQRARPRESAADPEGAGQARPERLRRGDQSDRCESRDTGSSAGPRPGSRRIHPLESAGDDGRLRLCSVRRRHLDLSGDGLRENSRSRPRYRARRQKAAGVTDSSRPTGQLESCRGTSAPAAPRGPAPGRSGAAVPPPARLGPGTPPPSPLLP